MTTRCSVCDHENRDKIEHELRAGKSLRLVARATGIGKDALHRHMKNHAELALAEAVERRREAGDDGTSDDDLGDLRSQLALALEVAMSKGDFTRASSLARELRQVIVEIEKVEAARALRDRGPSEPPTLRVVYDDPPDVDAEIDELLRRRGLGDVAGGWAMLRRIESKFGGKADDVDLTRLTEDEMRELERILTKALHGDAVEAEVVEPAALTAVDDDEGSES